MSKKDKLLALPSSVTDSSWDQIINEIAESVSNEDLPEKVIEGLEMMLVGFPTKDIASELGVRPDTVRGWISRYPIVGKILADQRGNLIRWRLARMEQQFYQALKLSETILKIDINKKGNTDPKLVSAVGSHVRFILSMYVGHKIDVNVTHNLGDATLRGGKDALNYVADRLINLLQNADTEPIEATYRVVDPKYESGPLLKADGEPHYGTLSKLDINQDGVMCHICGKRYKALRSHITRQHNLDAAYYETIFMLEGGSVQDKYEPIA